MVRKNEDSLKAKASGDEIDSMNTLVNELYEKIVDIENRKSNILDGGETSGG